MTIWTTPLVVFEEALMCFQKWCMWSFFPELHLIKRGVCEQNICRFIWRKRLEIYQHFLNYMWDFLHRYTRKHRVDLHCWCRRSIFKWMWWRSVFEDAALNAFLAKFIKGPYFWHDDASIESLPRPFYLFCRGWGRGVGAGGQLGTYFWGTLRIWLQCRRRELRLCAPPEYITGSRLPGCPAEPGSGPTPPEGRAFPLTGHAPANTRLVTLGNPFGRKKNTLLTYSACI